MNSTTPGATGNPTDAVVSGTFFRDPKARAAGKDGRALHVAALCWSAAEGTDGLIPTAVLPLLAAEAEVDVQSSVTLVDVGLWHPADGGWQIGPEPSRLSAARAAAGRAGAAARWRARPPVLPSDLPCVLPSVLPFLPSTCEEEELSSSSVVAVGGSSPTPRAENCPPAVQLALPIGTDPGAVPDPRVDAALDAEVTWRYENRGGGRPIAYLERWRRKVRASLDECGFALLVSAQAALDPDADPETLRWRARGEVDDGDAIARELAKAARAGRG